ncbi:MAG: recombinase family protein [Magnetospirillum sp.]|nr:recombinase family protein [Magnetospirillum sp.]
MKVAAYYRVSTPTQAEANLSIPDQAKQAKAYCASKGLELVREFTEPGDSATDELRPIYQEMMEWVEGKDRPVDIVLVHSFSRFMRDAASLEFRVRSLRRRKVELISITQPVANDPTGDMVRQFFAMFDEYSSKENAKHTLRAMKQNAENGFWNGSRPPFGYRTCDAGTHGNRQKKRLEINPDEAPTVRLIFDLALKGEGVKNIAKALNERGIRHRGHRFHTGYVHRILRGDVYAGTHHFNRVGCRTREAKPAAEWVAMAVPAIIDMADFQKVQASLAARSPRQVAPRLINGPTLLTGIARCATCGGGMMLRTGKGGRYRYYCCATAARMGKSVCPGRAVRMDALDALVIDAFSRRVLHPGHVGDLLTGLIQDGATRDRDRQVKLGDLHRAFTEAQAVVDRLYSAIEKGVFDLDDPEAKERLAQARLRRDEAKRDLDAIRVLANTTPEITAERVERFTRLLRRHLEDGDVKLRRNWLGLFVDEVLVGDEPIIIRGPTPALAGGINGINGESLPSVPTFVRRWRGMSNESGNSNRWVLMVGRRIAPPC